MSKQAFEESGRQWVIAREGAVTPQCSKTEIPFGQRRTEGISSFPRELSQCIRKFIVSSYLREKALQSVPIIGKAPKELDSRLSAPAHHAKQYVSLHRIILDLFVGRVLVQNHPDRLTFLQEVKRSSPS